MFYFPSVALQIGDRHRRHIWSGPPAPHVGLHDQLDAARLSGNQDRWRQRVRILNARILAVRPGPSVLLLHLWQPAD